MTHEKRRKGEERERRELLDLKFKRPNRLETTTYALSDSFHIISLFL